MFVFSLFSKLLRSYRNVGKDVDKYRNLTRREGLGPGPFIAFGNRRNDSNPCFLFLSTQKLIFRPSQNVAWPCLGPSFVIFRSFLFSEIKIIFRDLIINGQMHILRANRIVFDTCSRSNAQI